MNLCFRIPLLVMCHSGVCVVLIFLGILMIINIVVSHFLLSSTLIVYPPLDGFSTRSCWSSREGITYSSNHSVDKVSSVFSWVHHMHYLIYCISKEPFGVSNNHSLRPLSISEANRYSTVTTIVNHTGYMNII